MSAPAIVRTLSGARGTPIRYRVEGAGPPLTLIHGVGANLESWDGVVARLAPHFTVARFDLRGHGCSGLIETCSMADFVADVAALLDELGLEATDLAGFSLGGLIAQHFATQHPARVRRLALLSTVAERTPEERARVLQRADLVRDDGIAAVATAASGRWFTPAFSTSHPERVAQRLQELVANDHRSYAAAYRVFGEADAGLRPKAITQPTLIVTGEHDQGSNPRMALSARPNRRLTARDHPRNEALLTAGNPGPNRPCCSTFSNGPNDAGNETCRRSSLPRGVKQLRSRAPGTPV